MADDRQGSGVGLSRRRIRAALGQELADLLLRGGQVVNVFTGQVGPANVVVVVEGWIAAVGPFDGPARETIDLEGRAVLPGPIDSPVPPLAWPLSTRPPSSCRFTAIPGQ